MEVWAVNINYNKNLLLLEMKSLFVFRFFEKNCLTYPPEITKVLFSVIMIVVLSLVDEAASCVDVRTSLVLCLEERLASFLIFSTNVP